MAPSGEPRGTVVSELDTRYQIVEWDGIIFFNSKPLSTTLEGRLLGTMIRNNGQQVVISIVTEYNVLQLNTEGEMIEKLDELSLPPLPLTAIAQELGTLYLKNAEGWTLPDADWLEYTPIDGSQAPLNRAALSPVENETVRVELQKNWSRGGLPLSRVILDLHSGRFFGGAGKYFYDIVSVCTLLLCVTGVVIFFRRPQRRKRKR